MCGEPVTELCWSCWLAIIYREQLRGNRIRGGHGLICKPDQVPEGADGSTPGPPASSPAEGGILDDVEVLDLSEEASCVPDYTERAHEILAELGIEVPLSAPNLPPVSELQRRIYSYKINVAKTWMPEMKRKHLDTKFDLYRHELVLLAQQHQRSKHKAGMSDAEKKALDAPINRRLASDLQRLMDKKLELVLEWLPSLTRKNLENDTIILRNQIIRENEMAKVEASDAAEGMSEEERELEERIMMHKLHVAESWMPKDVLEKLNNRFTAFQITSANDEKIKADEDIKSGMSPDGCNWVLADASVVTVLEELA
ncbi:uncharacterized protein [Chiloscyllium punctatum]|uniref:uncharacterized protein n=1 Tax=Chiloscyllium punctatum TaxID=137246 RepID=UPI003B64288D